MVYRKTPFLVPGATYVFFKFFYPRVLNTAGNFFNFFLGSRKGVFVPGSINWQTKIVFECFSLFFLQN